MAQDHSYLVKLAWKYLEDGSEEKARRLIPSFRESMPEDPDVCFGWARLCEELGLAKLARRFYENALRMAPGRSDILFCYASLLNVLGYHEDCLHYLKKAVKSDPTNLEAKKLLSEAYHALGFHGQAEALYPRKHPQKAEPVRYFPPSPGREHLERLLSLFSGRETGYALQQVDENTGDISYRFENGIITPELLSKHINGEITLGIYPLRSDKTLKYALLEISLRRRIIRENFRNKAYLTYLEERALDCSMSLRNLAFRYGFPSYLDYSGGYNYRLWFFFKEFVHFLKAKEFLKRLFLKSPVADSFVTVEPFTGTRGVGIGWMEHPVMLPFGINRATRRRSLFLDEDGRPYPEQLSFLKRIQEIPFKGVVKTGGKRVSTGTDILDGIFPETIEKMVSSCPVLSEISRKALYGRILSREEKTIMFYTVGLADEDGMSLHRVLGSCPDYSYEKVERQRVRLKRNPISCVKIRELVPELTASVSCNCVFDLEGGKYPSPLMYVNPHLVPSRNEFILHENIPIREAARRFVSLKKQAKEIDLALKKTAMILERYYRQTRNDRIRVGRIVIVRNGRNEEDTGNWDIRMA